MFFGVSLEGGGVYCLLWALWAIQSHHSVAQNPKFCGRKMHWWKTYNPDSPNRVSFMPRSISAGFWTIFFEKNIFFSFFFYRQTHKDSSDRVSFMFCLSPSLGGLGPFLSKKINIFSITEPILDIKITLDRAWPKTLSLGLTSYRWLFWLWN